jgi:hypothetical protein
MQEVVDYARTPLAQLVKDAITTETNKMLLDLQVHLQAGDITKAQHTAAEADVNSYKVNMHTNIDRRGKCPVLARFNYDGYPDGGALAGSVIAADVVWASSIGAGQNLIPVSLTPPAGVFLLISHHSRLFNRAVHDRCRGHLQVCFVPV